MAGCMDSHWVGSLVSGITGGNVVLPNWLFFDILKKNVSREKLKVGNHLRPGQLAV